MKYSNHPVCRVLLAFLFLVSLSSCQRKISHQSPTTKEPLLLDVSKKPVDANLNWKIVIGKYQKMEGKPEESFDILEKGLELYLVIKQKEYPLTQLNFKEYQCKETNPFQIRTLLFVIDKKNTAPLCKINEMWWEHQTYADKVVDWMTMEQPAVTIKKDLPTLVLAKEVDPTLTVDLKRLPKQPAYLNQEAALALKRANQSLTPHGYSLILLDAYRPKDTFAGTTEEGYDTGNTLSVTLFNTKSQLPVEMGSAYLELSERSNSSFTGGTSLERWHRSLLSEVMTKSGFTKGDRWWQFSYKSVN